MIGKFLRGVGAAASRAGEIGLREVLERRRQEGILRLQEELRAEGYKVQRADQVADEASRREFETKRDEARIAAAADEGKKNRETELERARIAAAAARETPAYDVAVSEEPILDALGKPVYTENARGETVIATRKVPRAFNRFSGEFKGGAGDDEPVNIDDSLLKRLRGESDAESAQAPSSQIGGGLARARETERLEKEQKAAAAASPLMRQGKFVQQRDPAPQPIFRNGKLVEQR